MSVKIKPPPHGTSRPREVRLSGTITIGSAGAVSAQAADGCATAVKTATKTGRYTVTFDRKYKNVRFTGAPTIVGPTDTAFGNTDANMAQCRNNTGSAFDIQLALASSGADTETTSGNIVHWSALVQE